MGFYDHPAFQGIDKNFLMYLERTFSNLNGKNSNEVMSALMTVSAEAKRYNINLNPAQQQVLIQQLRNSLPPNKRSQFDMILGMMRNQQR